jgi:hypothetical protein
MKTIKFIFILTTFLLPSFLKAQASINPAIQSTLDAFIDLSNKKEWDQAFDLIYPKLFNRVPKQELINVMLGMETDGLTLNMSNTRITSTSVPIEEGTETFVRVEYESDMKVDIKPNGMYDYPKSVMAIEQQFKSTYGEENVQWNDKSKSFDIKAKKAMMAVRTGSGSWKLAEINMDQPELMEYLFSPAVMDALVRIQ